MLYSLVHYVPRGVHKNWISYAEVVVTYSNCHEVFDNTLQEQTMLTYRLNMKTREESSTELVLNLYLELIALYDPVHFNNCLDLYANQPPNLPRREGWKIGRF
jgi:hypothetical protein